jgi:hypothetical protein
LNQIGEYLARRGNLIARAAAAVVELREQRDVQFVKIHRASKRLR